MSGVVALRSRHAIELGSIARIVLPVWAFSVMATGSLALLFGWAQGRPFSPLADFVLWPGSMPAFIVLGALPRRGGPIVGGLAGFLVGAVCAYVLAVLPDSALPVNSNGSLRWHDVLQAIGATPIVGLVLGTVGSVLRWLVQRLITADDERADAEDGTMPLLTDRLIGRYLRGLGFRLDSWTFAQVAYTRGQVSVDIVDTAPGDDVSVWFGLNDCRDYWPFMTYLRRTDGPAAERLEDALELADGSVDRQIHLWQQALTEHGGSLLAGDAKAFELMRQAEPAAVESRPVPAGTWAPEALRTAG